MDAYAHEQIGHDLDLECTHQYILVSLLNSQVAGRSPAVYHRRNKQGIERGTIGMAMA